MSSTLLSKFRDKWGKLPKKRVLQALVAASCLLVASFASASSPAVPSAPSAQDPATKTLFASHKASIVQVRLIPKGANEHKALGSGFVVQRDLATGHVLLVTNYHVISALAVDPDKFRIELRGTDEQRLNAELVVFDVVNDLAVLRTSSAPQKGTWPTLAWRAKPLEQGQKLFALGNPLQLGFLISEGTSNGEVEARWQRQLLFSGALNPGMSGGPTLDAQGAVVGINVARSGGEQLSFLVPAEHAMNLLQRAAQPMPSSVAPGSKDASQSGDKRAKTGQPWRPQVIAQVLSHERTLAQAIVGQQRARFSQASLSGRDVVGLVGDAARCTAASRDGDGLRYERDTLNCALRASVYVSGFMGGQMQGASISVDHRLLRNTKLATVQFLSVKPERYNFDGADPRAYALQHCTESDLATAAGRRYRVASCVRSWRRFEGLYQYRVTAAQIDDASQRLISRLNLDGVSFETGLALTRAFLEQLK